jgi:hypothetical protein
MGEFASGAKVETAAVTMGRNATRRAHRRWREGQEVVIRKAHHGVMGSACKCMKIVELLVLRGPAEG